MLCGLATSNQFHATRSSPIMVRNEYHKTNPIFGKRSNLPDSCLSPWQDIGYSLPFKRQRRSSRFDGRRKDFMRVDGYLPTYVGR